MNIKSKVSHMRIILTGNTAFKIANFRSNLLQDLIKKKNEVYVISPHDEYVQEIERLGGKHLTISLSRRGTSIVSEIRSLRQIFQKLKSIKPDIVLSYTIKNNIYFGICSRILGIPLIVNVTGLGPSYDAKQPLRLMIDTLYKFSFKKARVVFFQNDHDLQLFVRKKIIRPSQASLLPGSGVDLEKFPLSRMPNQNGPTKFLMVARLIKEKGVEQYIAAAKIIKRKYHDVEFSILGPFDPESKSSLTEQDLKTLIQDGSVKYLGASDDVLKYIKNTHCSVLPTYYREGTPRSLLEAAAVGRPIITTNIPGCRDVVLQDVTGYLVQTKSVTDLTAAFAKFLNLPPEDREEMGQKSREHIVQNYDEKIILENYFERIFNK